MAAKTKYYIVAAEALPEIFIKVAEAKRMMQKNSNARVDLLSELVHQYKGAKTLTKELERVFVEQVLVYDAEHIKIKWKFDDVFAALMGNE